MNRSALLATAITFCSLHARDYDLITPNELIPSIETSDFMTLRSQPICFLFAHGVDGNKHNVLYYNKHNIVRSPFFSFDFPDVHLGSKETSLAQENEIAAFKQAFDEMCHEVETKLGRTPQVVLTGVSRGASSAVTFMATHNPENVCALVLESPFDTITSVIRGMLSKVGLAKAEKLHKFGHFVIAKIYGKYDKTAPTPLDMVPFIQNKELPILISCSKKDELVPWDSSYRLYEAFKNEGFDNVHIFIASHGKHVRILEDRCADLYKKAADTFYTRYLNI